MNEFLSLTLEGMPFFSEKTTFNLNQKGVSLILGRNLDSSKNSTNGSGKSLFFSQLPEVLTDEPTIGVSKDVVRRGSVEFELNRLGHHYKVNRTFRPGEKIFIEKDGVNLEYRELSAAKAALKSLIPFNTEEVLSLLYLDSRIPHPLVRGTSATRKAFFTNFFRMNSAPAMRKLVKSELDGLKAHQGSYDARRSRLSEVNARLKEHNLEKLEARQAKVKSTLKLLEVSSKKYSRAEQIRDSWLEYRDEYSKLYTDLSVSSWDEAQGKAERIDEKLAVIAEHLSVWKRYDAWQEGQQEFKERKAEVNRALKQEVALSALSLKQMNALVEEKTATLESLDEAVEKIQSKLREVSETRENELNRDLKAARVRMKELEKAQDSCPTCGAAYDNAHAKKEIRVLDAHITDIQVTLEDMLEKRAVYETRRDQRMVASSTLSGEVARLKKVRKLMVERESWEEQASFKTPDTDKDTLISRRARMKADYSTLLSSKLVFQAREEWKSLTAEDKALLKQESPTDRLLQLHEESGEIKMLIEEVTGLMEEKATLSALVRELRAQIDEKPALELLFEGLSQKGVPSVMINLACKRLEQQVNKYARLLFPEDFHFTFDLETQFNILVTRKYGKRKETSDVRKLSGAESLLFSLILLIGLLSFVPAKNRCNLLILDEPTSTFGPEMIDAFVKFLPVLNSVIPHIVVITPMPNNLYEGARVYTVVKQGGKSRIIEGTDITKGGVNDSRRSRSSSGVASRRKASV